MLHICDRKNVTDCGSVGATGRESGLRTSLYIYDSSHYHAIEFLSQRLERHREMDDFKFISPAENLRGLERKCSFYLFIASTHAIFNFKIIVNGSHQKL